MNALWTRRIFLLAGVGMSFGLSMTSALAAYPERPIRLVVPYAPGGSTDIAGRVLAEVLGKQLNATMVVDNRPGNSGYIGSAAVARSAPDGYTLLFLGTATLASAPSLPNSGVDVKDLVPISKVVSSQFSILINPAKYPFTNLKDFLAYVRANPGKVDFASSGAMTSPHFAIEAFRQATNLDFRIIHYNGNTPANAAMMAGEPGAGFDSGFSAKGVVASGRLRALAVTGAQRSPVMPDVPTVAEAGIPGYTAGFSLLLLAPAGTPAPVVAQIHRALAVALKDPAVVKRFEEQSYEVVGSSPQEVAAELEREIQNNAKIIAAVRASEAPK